MALASLPTVRLFNVDIHAINLRETLLWIQDTIRSRRKGYIVTPNVDHVVRLQRDNVFYKAYQNASLVLPDGKVLIWASWIIGKQLREPAWNLFVDVCNLAQENRYGIYLLGADLMTLEKAVGNLQRTHPGIRIAGFHHGYFEHNSEVLQEVNSASPDILFVGMGCPKQEKWIFENIDKLNVRVAICVGGAFNYIAGIVERAPLWMRKAALEWFWRFLQEPRRMWNRYFVDDLPFFWLLARELWRVRVRRPA